MAKGSSATAPAEAMEGAKPPVAETKTEAAAATTTKKTVTRRMNQAEINGWIAYPYDEAGIPSAEEEPKLMDLSPEFLAKFPQHARDLLVEMDAKHEERIARSARLAAELREERDDILQQYREKGYVEYQVEVDEGPRAPPRRGRRRFRPGVVKQAGGVKKLN